MVLATPTPKLVPGQDVQLLPPASTIGFFENILGDLGGCEYIGDWWLQFQQGKISMSWSKPVFEPETKSVS